MATAGIVDCSPYGLVCTECNELLIAPNRSEYVSESQVRHLWSCETCGHKIDVHVGLRVSITRNPSKSVRVRPVSLVA